MTGEMDMAQGNIKHAARSATDHQQLQGGCEIDRAAGTLKTAGKVHLVGSVASLEQIGRLGPSVAPRKFDASTDRPGRSAVPAVTSATPSIDREFPVPRTIGRNDRIQRFADAFYHAEIQRIQRLWT